MHVALTKGAKLIINKKKLETKGEKSEEIEILVDQWKSQAKARIACQNDKLSKFLLSKLK